MRLKSLMDLVLVVKLLAGCLERGQSTMVNAGGDDDDAFCRANNVVDGSKEYVGCRKDRDVHRSNAVARGERKHRDAQRADAESPGSSVTAARRRQVRVCLHGLSGMNFDRIDLSACSVHLSPAGRGRFA